MAVPLIERICEAVRDGRHRFSQHALDELAADRLHLVDAESALLTGSLTRTEAESTPERPGPRYTVLGKATDLRTEVVVVCRFEPADQLLIITCYEPKNR